MIRRNLQLTLLCLGLGLGALAQEGPAHPGPTSRPAAGAAEAVPTAPVASPGGLIFTGAEGWVQEKPQGRMRVVQYRLPAVEGDAEDATVAVFWFGGSGGSVEANLTRWFAQFRQPDGSETAEKAKVEVKDVAGIRTHLADVTGTYVAETFPGSGERQELAGWRLLGAIMEAPSGPHFIKLIGPEKTVAHWEASFRAFLEAVKQHP